MSWQRTKCIILSCGATLKDFPDRKFFNFPKKNNENYVKWLELIPESRSNIESHKRPYICSKHFEPNDIGKKFLKKNAMPKLFLKQYNINNPLYDEVHTVFNPDSLQPEPAKIEVLDVGNSKCIKKDSLSSYNRFKNESDSVEEEQVDGETSMVWYSINICDAEINNKGTQTEVDFENSNQLKIIELENKLLLLEENYKKTLTQLQDANSLISKIFTKEQLMRLRNPNKKWNLTAEDIYSVISTHLSLLLSHQQQQQQPLAIGSTYRRDPHTQRPRIANPETDLVPLQQLQQQQQQQQTDLVPLQQQQQQLYPQNSKQSSPSQEMNETKNSNKSSHNSCVKLDKKLQQHHQQLQQHDNGFHSNIIRSHSNGNDVIPILPSRSSSSSLSTAQISSTGGGSKPYQCKICQKIFTLHISLNRHHQTHPNKRNFKCEFCYQTFFKNRNLQEHRRIHTKERPYKCDKGGRRFSTCSNFNRHMKLHTSERPHRCSFCNKGYIETGDLVQHMKVHSGERRFKCPVEACDKIFVQSRDLVRHVRVHTRVRPFKCPVEGCDKTFALSSSRAKHARLYTSERY